MQTIERHLSASSAPAPAEGSSSLQFDDLVEAIPTGCLLVDGTGVIHRANAAARETLGIRAARKRRPLLSAFVAPRQICAFQTFIGAVGLSSTPTKTEIQLRPMGEQPFWVRMDARQASTEEVPRGILLSIVDISDQRRMELQSRSAEATLHRVLESFPDAVFLVRNGEVIEVNPAGGRFLGRDTHDVVGKPFADFVADSHDKVHSALVGEPLQGCVVPSELRFIAGSEVGTTITAEVLCTPLDVAGHPCTLCVLRDHTTNKRLQAHLSHNDRLASVGVLAAGVAHEINNPLAYVMMSLDEILAELRGENAAVGSISRFENGRFLGTQSLEALAEHALDGTRRVAKIIEELRSFSRDDETTALVDVNRAVQKALSLAAPKMRHLVPVTDLGQVPPVQVNEGRLIQVVLNLIINAMQAVPQDGSGGKIEVCTRALGEEVSISVVDNGCGIVPEVRDRVFEPFVTTKEVGKGSGLGLFVCHKYISEYRGRIELESEPGQGTMIRVRLPAVPQRAGAPRRHPPDADLQDLASEPRIIVIDDEEPLRRSLKGALSRMGIVTTLASIDDAIQLLAGGENPDIILCDLHLPGRTGVELYDWIGRHRPSLLERIVLMTGGACTPQTRDFLRIQRPRLLNKPFSLRELRTLLAAVLTPACNAFDYRATSDRPDGSRG